MGEIPGDSNVIRLVGPQVMNQGRVEVATSDTRISVYLKNRLVEYLGDQPNEGLKGAPE